MERRDVLKALFGGVAGLGLADFSSDMVVKAETAALDKESTPESSKGNTMKKYTNADFYKDGVFQEAVAFEAYFDMFERMGFQLGDTLRANPNFWVAEFGLGDFENVGMAGIFFFNDKEFRYFGHDIYLLPGQMIPEHRHVAAEGLPAKHEAWQVRIGSIYNFSEGGDPNNPQALALIPKSQLEAKAVTCYNFKYMQMGDLDRLGRIEAPHFMMGGSEGTVVTEYACYHSPDGLKFTNPKAHS